MTQGAKMPSKELRRADWHEQHERDDADFRKGYAFYLQGVPLEPQAKPSPAFLEGWRKAKADIAKRRQF
jgi:hypothetical protein